MPNPFDPNSYGQPSFEDLMVGTLTESAARAKMEADERVLAEQLRRRQAVVDRQRAMAGNYRPPPKGSPGNPVAPYTDNDPGRLKDLNLDPSGLARQDYLVGPKGAVPLPPQVEAGQYGPKPGRFIHDGGIRDPREDSWAAQAEGGPLGLLEPASIDLDNAVLETGWLPEDFRDLSHAEGAARIADQLRTRRIRQMGEFSPDYIQSLPVY